MRVRVTHHVDASEPDAQGKYAYRYEYDLYAFEGDRVTYVARSYTSEPGEAHFLRAEGAGEGRGLSPDDLTTPTFVEAVSWLRANGKQAVEWLSHEGYEPVVPARTRS